MKRSARSSATTKTKTKKRTTKASGASAEAAVRPVDSLPVVAAMAGGALVLAQDDLESASETNAAFVFDDATLRFRRVVDPPVRMRATALGLVDDRVAIGSVDDFRHTAVVLGYDASPQRWRAGKELSDVNAEQLVLCGRYVLCLQGSAVQDSFDATHVYDVDGDNWRPGPALITPRSVAGTVRLPDGRTLLMGGTVRHGGARTASAAVDVVDSDVQAICAGPPLPAAVRDCEALIDATGRVLVVTAGQLWLFDAARFEWNVLCEDERIQMGMAPLTDGRIVFIGEGVQIYDLSNGAFVDAGHPLLVPHGRRFHRLGDGRLLAVGGTAWDNIPAEPELWDPAAGTSSPLPGLEKQTESQQAKLRRRQARRAA
jgi:hypothetical protein